MIIQLPLENWTDLLPFVPRRQLLEIVKQLCDRQFAKILQFFLTKEGQITLGHLRIVAPRQNDPNGGGPIVEVRKQFWSEWQQRPPSDLETNLPEGPMPNNVKDFKLIELSYFDKSVSNFLSQFQQEQQQPGNSLLDNVNLGFFSPISLPRDDDNIIMPILAQLMPMLGNINSISIYRLHHMEFGHSGLEPNNAYSQLLTTMLTKTRILKISGHMEMSMFSWCDFLYAQRNDGKPRALSLSDSFPDTQNLIGQIKKDFLKATHAVSFFVYVRAWGANVEWQDICLDNGRTNERLVVKIKTIDLPPDDIFGGTYTFVLISRYPVAANKAWIEANEKEIMGWKFHEQNRMIRFEQNLGLGETNDADASNIEQQEQQPNVGQRHLTDKPDDDEEDSPAGCHKWLKCWRFAR